MDAEQAADIIEHDESSAMISDAGSPTDGNNHSHTEQMLQESEDRFRRVVEHISEALVVDDRDGRILFANDRFLHLFGFMPQDVGHITFANYVAPDHRREVCERHKLRMRGESIDQHEEYAGLRHDGSTLWIESEVVTIRDWNGQPIGTQKLLRNGSDRKREEDILRESEERFRLVSNTAPVMIWMSGTDNNRIYVNKRWLEFTGRPLDAEIGSGWMEGIHPDDYRCCCKVFNERFTRRKAIELQYRLRRHDGEYRWIWDFGVPRFNPDGTFAGYIGSCIDNTERKLAEQALSTIGRRLIEAHEQERTWIGRELHDDIAQRLALLSGELDGLADATLAHSEVRENVRRAQKHIREICKDIQNLSHRLHSSKLEYLGLAKAAHSFCREIAEQAKIEVEFNEEGIPDNLPKEVSLCLFRVLQEALQNAVKHSGGRHFLVRLRACCEAIELNVADDGKGFVAEDATKTKGLGLVSMRERLQLLAGEFCIESRLGTGTTIHARVPLGTFDHSNGG